MTELSQQNGWVESYLEALLSEGLSSEYIKNNKGDDDEKTAKFNADRQVYSKYYVHQILQQGEEGLRDAWTKATNARHYEEKDARLEYLSWRVWFMKRNRARVKREDAKTLDAEKVELPPISEDLKQELTDVLHHEAESEDEEHAGASMAPAAAAGDAEQVEQVEQQQQPGKPPQRPPMAGLPKAKLPPGKPAVGAPRPIKTTISKDEQSLRDLSLADDEGPGGVDEQVDADVFDNRVDGLYIILISLHGLVRGDRMELGKDADTGGQVKYVVELAKALGQHPAVYRVDLLTRQIKDPKVDKTYGEPEERIFKPEGSDNDLGGSYIIRLPCGQTDQYLRKEKLWAHVREFADRGITHAKRMLTLLADKKTPCELYSVHGHYADAAEVAALMASTLNVDMCMTGHSLGRNKLEHLLASGTVSRAEIEQTYKISRRVEAEERGLESAIMVFTSTQQEVDEQWGLYDGYDTQLEKVLRHRRRVGRHMPCMKVIPPGLDFSSLKVDLPEDPAIKEMLRHKPAYGSGIPKLPDVSPKTPKEDGRGRADSPGQLIGTTVQPANPLDVHSPFYLHTHRASFEEKQPGRNPSRGQSLAKTVSSAVQTGTPKAGGTPRSNGAPAHSVSGLGWGFEQSDPPIWKEMARFLRNPRKPAILAMSRPDAKKNITTLVKAFGENSTLRELANLVLIMGNRDNIDSMAGGSQKVLNQVLKLIDAFDLYGSVAYPKKHQQKDISDIYRLPYATRGVFTNVALQEPFGLTVIEAAAHGVPTVATKNGGPVDIMSTLHHGLLVDPNSSQDIARALLEALDLGGKGSWEEFSRNGVKNIMAYSWPSHCKKYLESLESEKRFMTTHKRHKHRMSGSWDNSQGVSRMDRMSSTPFPEKQRPITHRNSRSRGDFWRDLDQAGDSPGADGQATGSCTGDQVNALGRKRLVAVPLDGHFRVQQTSELIRSMQQVAAASSGEIGVGLVSMLGFEDTKRELEGADVRLDGLDFIVCHSGADIWLSQGSGEGQSWDADEAYEQVIDFRWDRVSLQRLLTKLVTAPALLTPAPSTSNQGLAPLSRALSNMPDLEREGKGVHPHHVCLQLDREAKEILSRGKGRGVAVSTAIVDRLRRRLRSNGYRGHLTLQMAPGDGGELLSNVHITPQRASRALSLRYLASKFGLDMGDVAVVVLPPGVSRKGENFAIGSYVSDLAELVSGACQVFIQVPDQSTLIDMGQLDSGDAQSIDRLTVKVGPKLFGNRVAFVKEGEVAERVKGLPQQKADDNGGGLQS